MTTDGSPRARDAENWAKPVARLHVERRADGRDEPRRGETARRSHPGLRADVAEDVPRPPRGPEVTPAQAIREWKEHFPEFWPPGNQFYSPLTGIEPGEVALIRASVAGGIKLSTGVMVLYSDDESFTLMTPQGHMFAGWITFSTHEDAGRTVAQMQVLMRSQDPLSELGLALGGHGQENRFWQQTLQNLASLPGRRRGDPDAP